jgi:catechol 2,3-dioxygenase-like lactoylglutathione lyase family enzyme
VACLVAMAKLTYSCVLTRDLQRLDAFYRTVLQVEPRSPRDTYREFQTQPGIFALWSLEEFEQITRSAARHEVATGSVMLEFQVDDVDAEYERLRNLADYQFEFLLLPTTLAWGNRSIYFRDPDGNIINFFTPVR